MTSPITIRPLQAADHAAWLPLWRGYQQFYQVEIPAEVSRLTFGRLLDPAEPMHGFIAQDGDGLVGFAHLVVHRSTWTAGNYCYLQDLFTDPAQRRRGIAAALIEHSYGFARQAGCARVIWLTHETNEAARAVYDRVAERSGFIQYRKVL